MRVYIVPLELKIFTFWEFAVASLTLVGFVWYANWKARGARARWFSGTGMIFKRKHRAYVR